MKFFSTLSLCCFITVCSCLTLFSSCSPKEVVANLDPSSNDGSVKNGRLFFADNKKYLAYLLELAKLDDAGKEAKVSGLSFTALYSTKKNDFSGPAVYKYILNHNHEVQIGSTVVHMTDSDIYSVPADDEKLIRLLETNIASPELVAYKKSAIRSSKKLVPESATSSDPNARYLATYEDRRYHNVGPLGGTGNFRMQLYLREWCDGYGYGDVTVRTLYEYQSPRNGGWYAETYGQAEGTLSNISWTYRPPNDYGQPAAFTRSGTNPSKTFTLNRPNYGGEFVYTGVMDREYRDFGYTPEMRVELDFNLRVYYAGEYSTPWTGHAVFVTQ